MGIVGCYDLHLYCDQIGHVWTDGYHPGQYTGEDRSEAFKNARNAGWKISHKRRNPRDNVNGYGLALCPLHSGKKKK